jgi:hypothetical protein
MRVRGRRGSLRSRRAKAGGPAAPSLDLRTFPSAREDAATEAHKPIETPQTRSPAYRLAFADQEFLLRDDMRPVRLQLELRKPEVLQQEQGIHSTIVIFGSARIPEPSLAERGVKEAEAALRRQPGDARLVQELEVARRILAKSRYYDEARELARLVSSTCQISGRCDFVVITGGGPGIMEAANRGASDVGAKSIGLNIVLPHEQAPNPYITPELCFQFHYFAIRKMHFLMRAKALVCFPGGFGTLDELFEALTLIQTGKVKPIPVLLFGREFWEGTIRFEHLVAEGTISARDLDLFRYVESAKEAWRIICEAYGVPAGD